MNSDSQPSNFNVALAPTRSNSSHPRHDHPPKKFMKKLQVLLLTLLLGTLGPLVLQAQTTESYTFSTNRLVPDGNAAGLSDVRSIPSAIGNIGCVSVRLKLTGEFNGDMYVYLRHASGLTMLLNRAGKTAINPAGYADSGFNVTFQNGAANGDIHTYQSVIAPSAGSPLTGIWEPDGRTADPTNVTDLSARTTSLTNFVGLNAAGEWTLYLVDADSGGTNMLTQWGLDITGAASPTLTWTAPADIVYGTALSGSQLNASAVYNGTNVTGTFSYTPSAGTTLNAGMVQTLAVTFTPNDTNGFLPVTTSVSLNVTPAPLTITANSRSNVYGATLPVFTASYSGFVNEDTASSLTTPPALGTAATASSPTGSYVITASGAADANYAISYVSGTLDVTPAALTITANSASKVYGAVLPVFTASYSGFVNGDTASSPAIQPVLASIGMASSPAGTYPITAGGAADANYNISYVSGTLTIQTATITVAANNQSKAYGAALPNFTATYSGFVSGDTTNSFTSFASVSTTALPTSDVGTYPITASGASSANYAFSYVSGSLTVTQSLSTGIVSSSANPALPGGNVTFTMILAAASPGVGTPGGTVNFRIDGSIAGSGTLSGGMATYSTTSIGHGNHTAAAEYAGNLDFAGATNSLASNQVINTPPVAGNATLQRYPTQGVKVSLATLLANAGDADGDPLALTLTNASANGGTIIINDAWAFYTPAAGYTNTDSFTYTVSDGYGGSATGTVTVAIEVDTAPGQNLAITALGGGSYLISGSGIPGRAYRMQYTDSLAPANWLDILDGSVAADNTGAFHFTDLAGNSDRYYRSVYP